jgi:hypothetical protein
LNRKFFLKDTAVPSHLDKQLHVGQTEALPILEEEVD